MSSDPCEDCRAHSGLVACTESLKRRIKTTEDDVKSMRKLLIGTLISALLTLSAVLVNLAHYVMK